jgi:hypothetical protein
MSDAVTACVGDPLKRPSGESKRISEKNAIFLRKGEKG